MDIKVPVGTSVAPRMGGTVTFAGERGGYGKLVEVDHGNGYVTRYGHLSTLDVAAGDKVEAGQQVALSGNTGRSTAPHLHYEVIKDGKHVDPLGQDDAIQTAFARRTPQERAAWIVKAERARVRQQTDALRAVTPVIDNQVAQLADGVVPDEGEKLTPDQFKAAGLDDDAYSQYDETWRLGEQMSLWHAKPASEILAEVDSFTPQPGSDVYAAEKKRHAVAAKAADRILTLRQEDPARYMIMHNPSISEAYQVWQENQDDPVALRNYLAASLNAQEALGIAEDKTRALPKEIAAAAAVQFGEATDASQGLGMLAGLTIGLGHAGMARQVMDELVEAGVSEYMTHALGALGRGDLWAAEGMTHAIMSGPVKIEDQGAKDGLRDAMVGQFHKGAGQVLAVAAGWMNNPEATRRTQEQAALVRLVATHRASAGVEPEKAVNEAVRMVFGGAQPLLKEDLAAVMIGKDVNANRFERGLFALREDIGAVFTDADLAALLQQPGESADEVALAAGQREQFLADLTVNARWVNHDGGYALAFPSLARFGLVVLTRADETVPVFSAEKVLEAAQFDPEELGGGLGAVGAFQITQ
ncbi:MAG: hypothetical protein Kilf2KO_44420 [Rhodospirillales bacterium]